MTLKPRVVGTESCRIHGPRIGRFGVLLLTTVYNDTTVSGADCLSTRRYDTTVDGITNHEYSNTACEYGYHTTEVSRGTIQQS